MEEGKTGCSEVVVYNGADVPDESDADAMRWV